jgi:sugar transferase (PEP-CTERM system associated)
LCQRKPIAVRPPTGGADVLSALRRAISAATLLQLGAEASWLFFAVILAVQLGGHRSSTVANLAVPAFAFALVMVSVNGALGLYRSDRKVALRTHLGRTFVALLAGLPVTYLIAIMLPGGNAVQDVLLTAALIAFTGLPVIRHVVVPPLVKTFLPHRVLVLGTGAEAQAVEASFASSDPPGLLLVGFYPLDSAEEVAVTPSRVLAKVDAIERTASRLNIDEIIVAVREQRGGVLPMRGLLACRLAGIEITDLPRFFERIRGYVPIESLKASWLIYGNGFRQSWWRRVVKRSFDIVVASALLACVAPLMVVVSCMIALQRSGPVIYRQERVGYRNVRFIVFKFRSMQADAERDGTPRWAAPGDARVTKFGRFLRRSRIDELPQLLNVLRGEMSFVGPRPERPQFVAMLTEKVPFYGARHSVKPGITGWAQVRYSYGGTIEESARKLEYDLYYVKNNTLFLDLLILLETVRVVLLGEGAR